MITVEGMKYKVVENLGFNHSVGMYAKVCQTPSGEQVAVKDSGSWRWWLPEDAIRPPRRIEAEY